MGKALLLSSALFASSVPAPILGTPIASLDKLIGFSDPANCSEAPAFQHFRQSLFRYNKKTDIAGIGHPAIPLVYKGAFGRARYIRNANGVTVAFPVRGTWHGLQVRTFAAYAWNGGDPGGFTITFSEPPQKLLATVNRLGFRLPPSGMRELPDELEGAEIKVTPEKGGSLFGCTS